MSIPFVFLFSRPIAPGLGWQDGLGIGLWVVGIVIETVADFQKFAFKNKPENKKKMCTIGLWNFSRHPNYFGEILCWWGVWSLCTRAFDANGNLWLYWSIVSPLYVMTIILFLSGIPTLEKPWDEKYGDEESYRRYKKTTPPLIMWIPSMYAGFPRAIKLSLCCEFYCIYWKNWKTESDLERASGSDDGKSVNSQTELASAWEKGAHDVSYQNSK